MAKKEREMKNKLRLAIETNEAVNRLLYIMLVDDRNFVASAIGNPKLDFQVKALMEASKDEKLTEQEDEIVCTAILEAIGTINTEGNIRGRMKKFINRLYEETKSNADFAAIVASVVDEGAYMEDFKKACEDSTVVAKAAMWVVVSKALTPITPIIGAVEDKKDVKDEVAASESVKEAEKSDKAEPVVEAKKSSKKGNGAIVEPISKKGTKEKINEDVPEKKKVEPRDTWEETIVWINERLGKGDKDIFDLDSILKIKSLSEDKTKEFEKEVGAQFTEIINSIDDNIGCDVAAIGWKAGVKKFKSAMKAEDKDKYNELMVIAEKIADTYETEYAPNVYGYMVLSGKKHKSLTEAIQVLVATYLFVNYQEEVIDNDYDPYKKIWKSIRKKTLFAMIDDIVLINAMTTKEFWKMAAKETLDSEAPVLYYLLGRIFDIFDTITDEELSIGDVRYYVNNMKDISKTPGFDITDKLIRKYVSKQGRENIIKDNTNNGAIGSLVLGAMSLEGAFERNLREIEAKYEAKTAKEKAKKEKKEAVTVE